MQAQRACCREAVKSYKGKRASMRLSIRGNELTIHEPHVSVKIIRSAVAGGQVCPGSSQQQVGLADDATEIANRRGVMTCIGIRRIAFDRTGEKEVDRCAKRVAIVCGMGSGCTGHVRWASSAAKRCFGDELSTRPTPATPAEVPINLRREILMLSSFAQ